MESPLNMTESPQKSLDLPMEAPPKPASELLPAVCPSVNATESPPDTNEQPIDAEELLLNMTNVETTPLIDNKSSPNAIEAAEVPTEKQIEVEESSPNIPNVELKDGGPTAPEDDKEGVKIVAVKMVNENNETKVVLYPFYPCSICGLRFLKTDLDKHYKTHIENLNLRRYDCKLCPRRSYKYPQGLAQHNYMCHRSSYPCEMCGTEFPKYLDLQSHMKEDHQQDQKKSELHACIVCKQVFKDVSLYKAHVKGHEDDDDAAASPDDVTEATPPAADVADDYGDALEDDGSYHGDRNVSICDDVLVEGNDANCPDDSSENITFHITGHNAKEKSQYKTNMGASHSKSDSNAESEDHTKDESLMETSSGLSQTKITEATGHDMLNSGDTQIQTRGENCLEGNVGDINEDSNPKKTNSEVCVMKLADAFESALKKDAECLQNLATNIATKIRSHADAVQKLHTPKGAGSSKTRVAIEHLAANVDKEISQCSKRLDELRKSTYSELMKLVNIPKKPQRKDHNNTEKNSKSKDEINNVTENTTEDEERQASNNIREDAGDYVDYDVEDTGTLPVGDDSSNDDYGKDGVEDAQNSANSQKCTLPSQSDNAVVRRVTRGQDIHRKGKLEGASDPNVPSTNPRIRNIGSNMSCQKANSPKKDVEHTLTPSRTRLKRNAKNTGLISHNLHVKKAKAVGFASPKSKVKNSTNARYMSPRSTDSALSAGLANPDSNVEVSGLRTSKRNVRMTDKAAEYMKSSRLSYVKRAGLATPKSKSVDVESEKSAGSGCKNAKITSSRSSPKQLPKTPKSPPSPKDNSKHQLKYAKLASPKSKGKSRNPQRSSLQSSDESQELETPKRETKAKGTKARKPKTKVEGAGITTSKKIVENAGLTILDRRLVVINSDDTGFEGARLSSHAGSNVGGTPCMTLESNDKDAELVENSALSPGKQNCRSSIKTADCASAESYYKNSGLTLALSDNGHAQLVTCEVDTDDDPKTIGGTEFAFSKSGNDAGLAAPESDNEGAESSAMESYVGGEGLASFDYKDQDAALAIPTSDFQDLEFRNIRNIEQNAGLTKSRDISKSNVDSAGPSISNVNNFGSASTKSIIGYAGLAQSESNVGASVFFTKNIVEGAVELTNTKSDVKSSQLDAEVDYENSCRSVLKCNVSLMDVNKDETNVEYAVPSTSGSNVESTSSPNNLTYAADKGTASKSVVMFGINERVQSLGVDPGGMVSFANDLPRPVATSPVRRKQVRQKAKTEPKNKKIYECDTCGKRLYDRSSLRRHKKVHTTECDIFCEVCGKGFKEGAQLRVHLRTHTGERPHLCEICGKKFIQVPHLKRHVLTQHCDERPYSCEVCQKPFKIKTEMNRHMKLFHGNVENSYTCVCGRTFRTKALFERHLKLCGDEHEYRRREPKRPKTCAFCGEEFRSNVALAHHMKTEHPDKEIPKNVKKTVCVCIVCGKPCHGPVQLEIHSRVHTGLKPYECDICHKRFTQSVHLKCHMRTHTGEKPYKCHICGKGFALSGNLNDHVRRHESSGNLSCERCDRQFLHHGTFKKHMATVHGEMIVELNVSEATASGKTENDDENDDGTDTIFNEEVCEVGETAACSSQIELEGNDEIAETEVIEVVPTSDGDHIIYLVSQ